MRIALAMLMTLAIGAGSANDRSEPYLGLLLSEPQRTKDWFSRDLGLLEREAGVRWFPGDGPLRIVYGVARRDIPEELPCDSERIVQKSKFYLLPGEFNLDSLLGARRRAGLEVDFETTSRILEHAKIGIPDLTWEEEPDPQEMRRLRSRGVYIRWTCLSIGSLEIPEGWRGDRLQLFAHLDPKVLPGSEKYVHPVKYARGMIAGLTPRIIPPRSLEERIFMHHRRARRHLEDGRLGEALNEARLLLQVHPKSVRGNFLAGEIHAALGHTADAMEHCKVAEALLDAEADDRDFSLTLRAACGTPPKEWVRTRIEKLMDELASRSEAAEAGPDP